MQIDNVCQSKRAIDVALANIKGENFKLREANNRLRYYNLHVEITQLQNSENFKQLCALVDDIDHTSRCLKKELQNQRTAITDINEATCTTLGNLLQARHNQLIKDEEFAF